MTEPNDLVREYLMARGRYIAAREDLDEATSRLMKQMEADQRKAFKWTADGIARGITYVQQYMTDIDEVGLRKTLRAKTFDRYTKKVLDRKKMEAAMDAGEIDPVTVSRFVTQRPKKPFLTYTEKEAPE